MDTVQAVRTLFGPNRDPSIGKTPPPLRGSRRGGLFEMVTVHPHSTRIKRKMFFCSRIGKVLPL